MRDTAGEATTNYKKTFTYEPIHMDVSVLADQEELTYNINEQAKECSLEDLDDRDR